MGGKKKFIDKKNSATFQLIARDSSDPSFSLSDRVFVRVDNNPVSFPVAGDSVFEDAPDDDGPLPGDVRKEILELGFPDDGYNYLNHMREIKNTGAGSAFFNNPKFKLQHLPRNVKAYDASRLQISEADGEPEENSMYIVASMTTGVRVQKAVDPEVAALLDDDSDMSRLGSDVEDLEEDFVVQANLHEGEDDEEKDHVFDGINFAEDSVINRNQNNTQVLQGLACSRVTDDSGPLDGVTDGVPGVVCVGEKPRARRLLDEQFDLLEHQEYGTDDDNDDDDDGDYYANYEADQDESLAVKLKHSLNNHVMDDLEPYGDRYKVPADLLKNKEAPHEEQEDSAADVIRRCKEYAEGYEVEDEDKDVVLHESSDESEVWDCETIVSTYSILDNHPGKIEAPGVTRKKKLAETVSAALSSSSQIISLRGKEKLPVDFLPGGRKPATEKVKHHLSIASTEQYKRKQHGLESKEEKKERKAAVKEERREARRNKKEMKEFYRCEANRAQRTAAVSGPSSIHLL